MNFLEQRILRDSIVRPGNVLRVDDDGVFFTYKTAWHCPSCEKMVFSSAGLTSPHGEPLQTEDQEDANGVLEKK